MTLEFGGYGVVGPLGVFDKGLIFFDGFEFTTFKWIKSGTGADYSADNSNMAAFNGLYGVLMQTRLTGAAADDYVQILRTFPYPYRSKIWVRLRFSLGVITRVKTMKVEVNLWDGTKQRRAALRYVPATPAFQYLNTAGGWSSLAALAINLVADTWHELTFCLDLALNQYVSAFFSGKYADLRTVGYYEVGVNTTRQANIAIYLDAADTNRPTVAVDDVMVGEHVAI